MRDRGELRGVLAAALACLGLLMSAPSASAAVPSDFWGVVPQSTPTAAQFERLEAGGVDAIRVDIPWATVQSSEGARPDWSGVDPLVKGAALAGIEVLPFLSGAPAWAVESVNVGGGVDAPKTLPVKTAAQRDAWSEFLRLAVARYGPEGSLWSADPGLPEHPIRTWQIWNEENFRYFVAHPSPSDYGRLVQISHAALVSADPGAKIVLGGLFAKPREAQFKHRPPLAYFASDFLTQMYRDTPGVRSLFSGVALHPYTYGYRTLTGEIEAVRAALRANHDANKGLWITELGWSSHRPDESNGYNGFEKGPQGQAAQLTGAFHLLSRNRRRWHLRRVFWFSLTDSPGSCNFCDGSGLFGPGFKPKPAWSAFVRAAR